MREGLRISGLAKLSPKFLCHHFAHAPLHATRYTVHESCFDAICIVRILIDCLTVVTIVLRFLHSGINDHGMKMKGLVQWKMSHCLPVGSKNSFVSFLNELGKQKCNFAILRKCEVCLE